MSIQLPQKFNVDSDAPTTTPINPVASVDNIVSGAPTVAYQAIQTLVELITWQKAQTGPVDGGKSLTKDKGTSF